MNETNKAKLIVSSDTLGGYGLDLVFQVVQSAKFEGIDLSIWKNFDARNLSYVAKLQQKYQIPIEVIQVSNKVNSKELNYAAELAKEVNAKVITINPPSIFDFKNYKFIIDNISIYKKNYKGIDFAIINPEKSSVMMLPFIPKYYFNNIVDTIKNVNAKIGLDIANLEESTLEINFIKKIASFVQYLPVIYLSDKTKLGVGHVALGEGVLKLNLLFKKLKQNNFGGFFSLKINISRTDLSDLDKIDLIFRKCKNFYKEFYEDINIENK